LVNGCSFKNALDPLPRDSIIQKKELLLGVKILEQGDAEQKPYSQLQNASKTLKRERRQSVVSREEFLTKELKEHAK